MERPQLIRALIFATLCYLCVSQEDGIEEYATPKGCLAYYTKDKTGVALKCELESIDAEIANFSAIPSKYTQSISIKCAWPFYRQSSMENITFPPFPELKELVFQECKFFVLAEKDLMSFREHLLYLTIRSQHDATHALQVHSSAIGNLGKLQALDLAFNNMAEFPEKELCRLSDLQEIVFNHNALTNITSFGFSGTCRQEDFLNPCGSKLDTLDLAQNQLQSLPSKSFCKTPNLKQLDFAQNKISVIKDGAFSNLHSLQRLTLAENSITEVGPKTWLDLERLNYLNISHNKIGGSFDAAAFELLGELQTLDLGFNKIQTISKQSLLSLTNLTYLSLAANQIEQLDDGLFFFLSELQVLFLQQNRISTINQDTFSGMTNLKILSLEGNHLRTVDQNAFRTCHNLLALFLSDNNLINIPIISHLSDLLYLDLSTNKLSDLHESSFAGLVKLEQLSLKGNMLDVLPENLFANLTNLSFLDLSENLITSIRNTAFSHNLKLKSLHLKSNKIHTMFNLQINTQLTDLDMSYNSLTMVVYGFLPVSLTVFKADHNRIRSLEEVLYAASSTGITHMDLSNNVLTTIRRTSLPPTLQDLNLDYNNISYIETCSFSSMKSLKRVSLQANTLSTMLEVTLAVHAEVLDRPKFQLSGNSLRCSCDMLWMKTVNSVSNTGYALISDLENLYCWLPKGNQPSKYEISLIANSKDKNFLCEFVEHTFQFKEMCYNMNNAPPVCHVTCPENCSCSRDMSWNIVIIICSRVNATTVPRHIPVMSTVVYLDGNSLEAIDENSFEFSPKLQELYLNDSGLQTIGERSFSNMTNLRMLRLEHNDLQELKMDVFSGLVNLAELYLFSNKLHQIHEEVFVPLVTLHTLRLQNNQLTNFPVSEFSRMPLLSSITLGENPWSCDCDYVDKYHEWFQESAGKIVDIENLMCYPESDGEAISLINFNATFCADLNQISVSYIPVIVSMTVIFLAISGICVLIFIYRHEMQVLLYSRYGVRLLHRNREVNDDMKIYDAFISYSNDDEDLVVTKLLPKLENLEFPYKLCLHQRDFAVGAFITESILEAVDYSRRTIMILTDSFVRSEWCRFEFKTAHVQMMKDKCNRVIVILVGKIPKDLDPEMKLYLKTNTYLHWDDKLFWEKLYFALPEKRKI